MAKNTNFVSKKANSWQMFNDISPRYEFLNHLLSGGLDIYWRYRLCAFVPKKPNLRMLDLATGTGNVLFTVVTHCPQIFIAYGLDLAEKMLDIAKAKAKKLKLHNKVSFYYGDAQDIPSGFDYFDVVTMAFGIRNVQDPAKALSEIYRVLRHQGRALILEFSVPRNILIRPFFLLYLRFIVPLLGGILTGNFKAYQYLNQTIESFPCGEKFCQMLRDAQFANVKYRNFLGGFATIYLGEKIEDSGNEHT